jgi:hypothetical protein
MILQFNKPFKAQRTVSAICCDINRLGAVATKYLYALHGSHNEELVYVIQTAFSLNRGLSSIFWPKR